MAEIEKATKELQELIGSGTNITDEVMKIVPKRHRSTAHLKCDVCGKTYKYGKSLRNHFGRYHF